MGADAPMMRSRQRGHRTCHHPWCGPDSERPARERHDERPRCTCRDTPWGDCDYHDALHAVRLVPVDEDGDLW